MTNRCRWILIIVCIAFRVNAVTAGGIELLPATRIIPPFTANPTEHRLSLAKVFEENRYIAAFGAVVPLAEYSTARTTAQISIAGSFYTHLSSAEHQFIVTTGDYFVDALLDVQPSPSFALRAGLGHTSQHLMDDALEVTGLPHSINYVRDYAQLFVIHNSAAIGGFLYAGCFYNYTFIINEHRDGTMIYELGGEALNVLIAPLVRIYIAADIKLKGESAFGTTQNYQVGLNLARDGGGRTLRCALNYQTGLEERGQFFGRRISQTSFGFYLDL